MLPWPSSRFGHCPGDRDSSAAIPARQNWRAGLVSAAPTGRRQTRAGARRNGGVWMSKSFEQWVEDARHFYQEGEDGEMHDCIITALEALAAERAAERMTPRFEGPIETLRQPRSISHWGLH